MPKFPIVDSHVHLYDIKRFSYGWLAGVLKTCLVGWTVEDINSADGKFRIGGGSVGHQP